MAFLSFQKPVLAAAMQHMRSNKYIEYGGLKIHEPAVVNASVSSGKSYMIGGLAQAVWEAGLAKENRVKVLCVQVQGILCEQNHEAANDLLLKSSVFSASAFGGRKSFHYDVIYATIGTLDRALDHPKLSAYTEEELALPPDQRPTKFHPDLIIPDEGHQIPWDDPESMYMKVIMHFYRQKPKMRVITMTGSPFRGTESILGPYWQKFLSIEPGQPGYPEGGVGNGIISTEFMIDQGWVVPPQFGVPAIEGYDFSSTSWDSDNEFELNALTESEKKLAEILGEVITISKDRKGVLIFAATQRHAKDIVKMLERLGIDPARIGLIIDKTSQKEQTRILKEAKDGRIKFTVNVGVLTTGVNVPWWDTLVFMRPIGTLTLLTQAIGRVLRLLLGADMTMPLMDLMSADERKAVIAASDKPDSLVLDYAGVMDRLGHLYENPILEQAELDKARKKNETQFCPVCDAENSIHARRCIGKDDQGVRCEHFYKYNLCPDCGTKNDVVARQCRNVECARQLIDPNENLSNKHYTDAESMRVLRQTISANNSGALVFKWDLADGRSPTKFYYPGESKNPKVNKRIFYNEIIKEHCITPAHRKLARNMTAYQAVEMAQIFECPSHMSARCSDKGKWSIGRKVFAEKVDQELAEVEL